MNWRRGKTSDRNYCLDLAARLARPLLDSVDRGGLRAAMPLEQLEGSDRAPFTALEALGRLLSGLAPLLTLPDGEHPALPKAAFQRLLTQSVTPGTDATLDFAVAEQSLVDAAYLAQAIMRAPKALFHELEPAAQGHLIDALRATRRFAPINNNHLLFPAMIEVLFCKLGEDWDKMRVDLVLRQFEKWYLGDGIYSDGPKYRSNYYNSYTIHPFLTDILRVLKGRTYRWDKMREAHAKRQARLAITLERLIGPDGTYPPLGRSITYRNAAFAPLSQLALQGELPPELSAGAVRGALTAVARRTLDTRDSFDRNGWLRIGVGGHQPELGEHYVSTGSLYICATGLLHLGLPQDDPFWTAPPAPWSQKALWETGETIARDLFLKD